VQTKLFRQRCREKERESVIEAERRMRILCVYVWSIRSYREMQKNQGQGRLGGGGVYKSVFCFYYLIKKINPSYLYILQHKNNDTALGFERADIYFIMMGR